MTTTRTKLPTIAPTDRRVAAAAAFLAADEASKVASAARSEARDLVDRVCPKDGRIETPAGVVNVTTQTSTKVNVEEALARLPEDILIACLSSLDADRLADFRDLGFVSVEDFDAIVGTSSSRRVAKGR